jgi:hypothetical protein
MSESKHTSGPWYCEKQYPDAVATAIGEPIAIVGGEDCCEDVEFIIGRTCDYGPHGNEQTEANARLIAAAPDLLKALTGLVRFNEDDPDYYAGDDDGVLGRLMYAANAAIAQATGKTV